MGKLEELLEASKLNELLRKNGIELKKDKKCCNPVLVILAVVGGILLISGIIYGIYRYFTPDYLEDFEDSFDEEDDFDEEEEENESNEEDEKESTSSNE